MTNVSRRQWMVQAVRCRRGRHRWRDAATPVERWGQVSVYVECACCPASGWRIVARIINTRKIGA